MEKYCFKLHATVENNLKAIEDSVENFKDEILLMTLTRAQNNLIFKLTQSLFDKYSEVICNAIPSTNVKLIEDVNAFHRCLNKTLKDHNSDYKRNKK